MNNVSHSALIFMCALIVAACGKTPKAEDAIEHVVPVTSVTTLHYNNGRIINAPADTPTVRVEAVGCQFSAKIGGVALYFNATNTSGGDSSREVNTCALLSAGDLVSITEFRSSECTMGNRGSTFQSKFRWRDYCLRSAL